MPVNFEHNLYLHYLAVNHISDLTIQTKLEISLCFENMNIFFNAFTERIDLVVTDKSFYLNFSPNIKMPDLAIGKNYSIIDLF